MEFPRGFNLSSGALNFLCRGHGFRQGSGLWSFLSETFSSAVSHKVSNTSQLTKRFEVRFLFGEPDYFTARFHGVVVNGREPEPARNGQYLRRTALSPGQRCWPEAASNLAFP